MNLAETIVRVDRRVWIVSSKIEDNFYRGWSAQELGQLVNLSPSRLRHLFKHQTGETLRRHLISRRLQEARLLLLTTTLSVKEIRNRVGIADASNFTHQFQKEIGMSPTMYREGRSVDAL